MKNPLEGSRVLITGGAGAFGQKFIASLAAHSPRLVRVFSRDEMKHAALKRQFAASRPWLECRIGDVTDRESLEEAMSDIDIVVHAAAMKHLPECEANVAASTLVNVRGTENVAKTFLRSTSASLIFLSTDKAPYASSVYGAQKYIGEKIIAETAARSTAAKRAFSLRYSNVIDSTGAAFHIFGDMLKAGKKVTVNGSQTVRGFVTQRDVIDCIETSLCCALGGEGFVLKPRVVRISELATSMCELLGRGEVEIRETTSFLGEKDSATLIMGEESSITKELPEFKGEGYLLDYLSRHPKRTPASLKEGMLTLEQCETLEGDALKRFLKPVMEANSLL